jgi:hypothetical protein
MAVTAQQYMEPAVSKPAPFARQLGEPATDRFVVPASALVPNGRSVASDQPAGSALGHRKVLLQEADRFSTRRGP